MVTNTTNDIARQISGMDTFDIRPILRDDLAMGIDQRNVSLDLHANPHRCTLRINGSTVDFEMSGSLHITDARTTEERATLITGRIVNGRSIVLDGVAKAA